MFDCNENSLMWNSVYQFYKLRNLTLILIQINSATTPKNIKRSDT